MTNLEFSDQFDVLYNNITSNKAPGLDEYEKSVFLTKAQDDVVKAYFDPKLNKSREGYDGGEKRQIDFSMIMRTKSYKSFTSPILDNKANTKRVTIDRDIMMFVNEFVDVKRIGYPTNSLRLSVVPISYSEYARLQSKPYKRPLQYQSWRLIDSAAGSNSVELIVGPSDAITNYTARYIKKPRAIRLADLGDVTLDGASTPQECELDSILHIEILQRAVELAKAAYTGGLQEQLALGTNSGSNIGLVAGGQQ